MEEGDEGLVAGLDEQDAERVVIEGNPLKCPQDRVQDGPTSDCGPSDVQKERLHHRDALFPMPPTSLSEKTAFSW